MSSLLDINGTERSCHADLEGMVLDDLLGGGDIRHCQHDRQRGASGKLGTCRGDGLVPGSADSGDGDRLPGLPDPLATMKNIVREMRLARDLAQGQLAEAMGVSRQTINSIENERYTPSLPLAMALARYFGVSVEELFDDQ